MPHLIHVTIYGPVLLHLGLLRLLALLAPRPPPGWGGARRLLVHGQAVQAPWFPLHCTGSNAARVAPNPPYAVAIVVPQHVQGLVKHRLSPKAHGVARSLRMAAGCERGGRGGRAARTACTNAKPVAHPEHRVLHVWLLIVVGRQGAVSLGSVDEGAGSLLADGEGGCVRPVLRSRGVQAVRGAWRGLCGSILILRFGGKNSWGCVKLCIRIWTKLVETTAYLVLKLLIVTWENGVVLRSF